MYVTYYEVYNIVVELLYHQLQNKKNIYFIDSSNFDFFSYFLPNLINIIQQLKLLYFILFSIIDLFQIR